MQPTELLRIMSVAEKLKCNTRHCYTSSGRHESVAEHSWRLGLFAMLVANEFPEADMDKVIRISHRLKKQRTTRKKKKMCLMSG